MDHVTFHPTRPEWHSTRNASLHMRGTVFVNNALLSFADTANHLPEEMTDPVAWQRKLLDFNGFFALIHQSGTYVVAAVDRIRSIPLFYGQDNGHLYISDDAEWVRQQVGDHEMDPVAREEFQLAGYVTGSDTLFLHVKQLQAGEFLVATQERDGVRVETHRYYRFLHAEPDQFDEPALRDQLDQAAVACIQRLIDYANGRQIVVPLSGGYDSRLIVTLLKRMRYDNVLTFTYGVPGNKESAYSKRVADSLGLRWYFVKYSEALWRGAWQKSERWEYQKWASGWNSIAHVQDWLAVKILKEQRVPEPGCLFVPGHTGDFLSGGHIPPSAFECTNFTLADAGDAIFSKHYGLAPLKLFTTSRKAWAGRILNRMERDRINSAWEYADVCEKWEWQERQAKFICNSVRVYEFFEYDWWMPFWDVQFMEFWQGVQLSLREKRQWYIKYVKRVFSVVTTDAELAALENAADKTRARVVLRVREQLRKLGLNPELLVYNLPGLGAYFLSRKTQGDELKWYSKYHHLDVYSLLRRGFSQTGINAYDILKSVEFHLDAER